VKDLFFWAVEYRFFNKVYGEYECHKASGVIVHYINLRANLALEGTRLIHRIQEHVAKEKGIELDSVIVMSLSRLTDVNNYNDESEYIRGVIE
jgi:hypothetical protein